MRWTNAELAAHEVGVLTEVDKAARGEASAYDGTGPNAEVDERIVASIPERDPGILANLLAERGEALLQTVRAQPPETPVAVPRWTVAVATAIAVADHHLHGGQIAETSGSSWAGDPADLAPVVRALLPATFNSDAAGGFHASYSLRLRGAEPVRYEIADGKLLLDIEGPVNCSITADPQTFLRLGIGVVSQLRAVVTGNLRASGRKPWLALPVMRLFPPFPHGGVAI